MSISSGFVYSGYQFILSDNNAIRCNSTVGTTDNPLTNLQAESATFTVPRQDSDEGYSAKAWIRLGGLWYISVSSLFCFMGSMMDHDYGAFGWN